MRSQFVTILSLLTLVFLLAFSACVKDSTPVETYITATPDSVFPGDTVNLEFTLTGGGLGIDILTLEWKSGDGSFIQGTDITASMVKWIAPKIPGDHFITLATTISVNVCHDSLLVHVKDTMGSFVDSRDNHEYSWVKIGSQIWMAENLAYLPSVSPPNKGSETEPSYYVYGYEGFNVTEANSMDNYEIYGTLYNWDASNVACPEWWHLPSDDEWKTLERFSGMSEYHLDYSGWRPSRDVSIKLKSSYGWKDDRNGINSLGFNALPGGWLTAIGSFHQLTETAYFWSSTLYKPSFAMHRGLFHYEEGVYRFYITCKLGFSVRCVKDE